MQTVVEYLLVNSMRPIIRAGCFPGIMVRNFARRPTCVITTTISTLAILEELALSVCSSDKDVLDVQLRKYLNVYLYFNYVSVSIQLFIPWWLPTLIFILLPKM